MKRPIKTLCGLLTVVLLLASCMKSNDNTTTLYSDTAIIDFSLGTLNRYLHTTSSKGTDSIYKVTVTGSSYKMTIDHANRRIFNTDSLPTGTDVKHVICSVSTLNNGSVFVEDTESDDLLFTSDSVDFSTPRVFRVYANDGSGYQAYTVQLNVHKEEENQFRWIAHEANADFVALEDLKAFYKGNFLYVFGTKGGKTLGYATSDGDEWTPLTEIEDGKAYSTIQVYKEALYMVVNGALQKSDDGLTWTVVNPDVDIDQLVAAASEELYGLTADGTLLKSEDDGLHWAEDMFDTETSMLPTSSTASVCYPAEMTYFADYVLLAGTSSAVADISSVWRKIVEYDFQGISDKWVYMDRSDGNRFALPQMENLVMIYYGSAILAWGADDHEYSPIYQSRDNGLIWKENSHYFLPSDFLSETVAPFAAATDGKEIWLISSDSGKVWHGHLNKVAWKDSEED